MIRLHPIPDHAHDCPYCGVRLEAHGWLIAGMRNLADLTCPQCKRAYYGDLPAGHGLYYPALLEQVTGMVHDPQNVGWFSSWLADSYKARTNTPISLTVSTFSERRAGRRTVLLNCLDRLYGHSLLKLLNASYYLDQPDCDLIVLIPPMLRWLVPDGVAAIWTAALPLNRGLEWNDALAESIRAQVAAYDELWLSVAFSHPADVRIERFTRTAPFNLDRWTDTPPRVTYIWRDDRTWGPDRRRQTSQVRALAEALCRLLPNVRFTVAGLGTPGGLPAWIDDQRAARIDESQERRWCALYAESQLVIGVHGSNMLLPSAHAGALIVLMPDDRWNNRYQDVLISTDDARLALCRYTPLPIHSTPAQVAHIAHSTLTKLPIMRLNFGRGWLDHDAITRDPFRVQRERAALGGGAK